MAIVLMTLSYKITNTDIGLEVNALADLTAALKLNLALAKLLQCIPAEAFNKRTLFR